MKTCSADRVIEALWERLGLKKTLTAIEQATGATVPYERALLAMVANRLSDPESKLGVWDRWLSSVYLPSCTSLKLRQLYQAMDLLHDHAEAVEKAVFFSTANLFIQPGGGSDLLRYHYRLLPYRRRR